MRGSGPWCATYGNDYSWVAVFLAIFVSHRDADRHWAWAGICSSASTSCANKVASCLDSAGLDVRRP